MRPFFSCGKIKAASSTQPQSVQSIRRDDQNYSVFFLCQLLHKPFKKRAGGGGEGENVKLMLPQACFKTYAQATFLDPYG